MIKQKPKHRETFTASEITDDELERVSGGLPPRHSKTLDIPTGEYDVDKAF